jgi:hypothetical protein
MSGINKANQRQNKRHGAFYQLYRNSKRREINKLKRAMRNIKNQPFNYQLLKCINALKIEVPIFAKKAKIEEFIDQIHTLRKDIKALKK